MAGNSIGERFVVTSFGESHGRCVGVVIDGCPAGLPLSEEDVQPLLDLRRPGQSLVASQRREEDRVEILSGVFNGFTTGAPIAMVVWNKDVDSRSYKRLLETPRPGHADYFARVKYGGFNDWRGGGRFSGRITTGFVMAGAVAIKLLRVTLGTEVLAYVKRIDGVEARELPVDAIRAKRYSNDLRCPDEEAAERMRQVVLEARGSGDSVGSLVECLVLNVPPGLGEPVFSSLDSDLARGPPLDPCGQGHRVRGGLWGGELAGLPEQRPAWARRRKGCPGDQQRRRDRRGALDREGDRGEGRLQASSLYRAPTTDPERPHDVRGGGRGDW